MAPVDHVIVLFGATGDLAKRKLLPGLHRLCQLGLMPEDFRIIGASRRVETGEQFRAFAREAIDEFGHEADGPDCWDRFGPALSFVSTGDGLGALSDRIAQAKAEIGADSGVLFYLALPPNATAEVVAQIGAHGLADGARVICEKPFGTDLASARELNARMHEVFDDSQIFRIDHYAGREAVQNLLAVRFANGMLEPVWNREHVDHIQIDVPETLSIGMRASFYEETGAFRDMVVTHLFQILGFIAMEPPTSFEAKNLIAEKTKVFESMAPLGPVNVVRGQYDGYRDVEGVAPDSDTETFVALRVAIDNWRWEGVPFYLRTGKKLAENHHQMTVAFKAPPRQMFPVDARYSVEKFGRDHLTFELGDPPSISMSFLAKVPGPTIKLGQAHMTFSYQESLGGPEQALDAYERLIYDVMLGDPTLFNTAEGIERLWDVSAPVLERPPPLHVYEQGSWGPEASKELIAPRHWHLPGTHA